MKNLAQLECYKPGWVLLTSHNIIIAIRQLYRSSEIITRLLRHRSGQPKNYNTSTICYIDSVCRPVALSSLRQNQRKASFIDQHDNAPAHTARLDVNFQAANIILELDKPPLSQDMPAIELLIATLKSKGIAI